MNEVAVAEHGTTEAVPQSLINDINRPAAAELDSEGGARSLLDSTHTLDAVNLCPGQGKTAASGFRKALSS